MLADFGWTCANYLYTPLDVFSTTAYETFKKRTARERNIRLASSVSLKSNPTTNDISNAVADIMKSDCLVTIMSIQTPRAADVVYEAHRQGYQGEFVTSSTALNIRTYLHLKAEDDAHINSMMRGIFSVAEFNGIGTARSVLVKCNAHTFVQMKLTRATFVITISDM